MLTGDEGLLSDELAGGLVGLETVLALLVGDDRLLAGDVGLDTDNLAKLGLVLDVVVGLGEFSRLREEKNEAGGERRWNTKEEARVEGRWSDRGLNVELARSAKE